MGEVHAGSATGFAEGTCRLVTVDGREVGLRVHDGAFYAYENRCLHQGGPVCEGIVVGRVEEEIDAEGATLGQRFVDDAPHLVCPWHAFEYDLRTGELVTDRSRKLRRYEVVQRGEELYVVG